MGFHSPLLFKIYFMIDNISNIVRDLVGSKYLYFDTALTIKLSPHSFPVNIWAVCTTPAPYNLVYVMDAGENWFQVDENDKVLIESLYQRVQTIKKLVA